MALARLPAEVVGSSTLFLSRSVNQATPTKSTRPWPRRFQSLYVGIATASRNPFRHVVAILTNHRGEVQDPRSMQEILALGRVTKLSMFRKNDLLSAIDLNFAT